MTWRGIIRATKSKYREPKHLANENFSLNKLDVTINHEKMSLSSLCHNRRIYQEFARRKLETRQTITKLKHEFRISDNEMRKVFKLPF